MDCVAAQHAAVRVPRLQRCGAVQPDAPRDRVRRGRPQCSVLALPAPRTLSFLVYPLLDSKSLTRLADEKKDPAGQPDAVTLDARLVRMSRDKVYICNIMVLR